LCFLSLYTVQDCVVDGRVGQGRQLGRSGRAEKTRAVSGAAAAAPKGSLNEYLYGLDLLNSKLKTKFNSRISAFFFIPLIVFFYYKYIQLR
jgi:hypothetical protein